LLKELAEDKKSLEKAQQESADLEAEISEKDRLAGKVLTFSLSCRLNNGNLQLRVGRSQNLRSR